MKIDIIEEGKPIVLYCRGKKWLLKVEDREFHTHFGVVNLGDLIGKPYGCYVETSSGERIYVLKPLLVDFIEKLPRKTQIIYPKDLGLILVYADISSGSRVVEAGTGSGALTSLLAMHVKPNGVVYSYEKRREFLEIAKRNLANMGLDKYVRLCERDVVEEGFDVKDVDTVILDLDRPWDMVSHVYEVLKPSRPFIVFVPTFNQLEKMWKAISEHGGFIDFKVFEQILREIKVEVGATRPYTRGIMFTGYVIFCRKVLNHQD
ncbi:protein methyltransferase [archaeon]|nr:MAG: protein methyltransferase [archaeon]RLG66186.1 MAG: protein methyltransferase [archaeon]HDM24144.1 tRNA (adenine-N1)-methyltransferase [Candidatus Bathyarchaeota archaeon]